MSTFNSLTLEEARKLICETFDDPAKRVGFVAGFAERDWLIKHALNMPRDDGVPHMDGAPIVFAKEVVGYIPVPAEVLEDAKLFERMRQLADDVIANWPALPGKLFSGGIGIA